MCSRWCGSLQQRSTNRAALDAASRFLLGRNETAIDHFDRLSRIPLGIASPRTKTDSTGAFIDPTTIQQIEHLAETLVRVPTMSPDERLDLVGRVVAEAAVDPSHINSVIGP